MFKEVLSIIEVLFEIRIFLISISIYSKSLQRAITPIFELQLLSSLFGGVGKSPPHSAGYVVDLG